jgi:predicted component of type VI protein secretion system
MGRGTHDNAVDIDLGKEGRANKVSRQQASLKLKEDGVFYLRNLGRRSLTVNNNAVETGQRAILGSNCLIEVGGMRFIFEINKRLVKQQVERMREQTS